MIMKRDFLELDLPDYWASALVNGDMSGYSDQDIEAIDSMEKYYLAKYKCFFCVDIANDESGDFRTYHDAKQFGVLACNVWTYYFDID